MVFYRIRWGGRTNPFVAKDARAGFQKASAVFASAGG